MFLFPAGTRICPKVPRSRFQGYSLGSEPWAWILGGRYFFLLGLYGQEEVREPSRGSPPTLSLSLSALMAERNKRSTVPHQHGKVGEG